MTAAWLQLPVPSGRAFWEYFTTGRLLGAAFVLITAWLVIRWLSRLLDLLALKAPQSRLFIKWAEPVLRIAIWFGAIFSCAGLLAPTHDTFLALLASMGIAIGLGAQDLVKNLIGGIVVLADRPYQLGDRVKIGSAYGEIDHIGLRSTKLTTPDDTRVTIPNANILSAEVWNANSGVLDCQVVTDLFLPPGTDPDVVLRTGYRSAYCSPYLLLRKPVVCLVADVVEGRRQFLRLRVKAYVHDHRFEPRMQSDITTRAKREFARLGLLPGG
ncbi:MAG: mechanosensitive ion channel [Bryobacterales bacterium]|nr:mechanosensitive ion channel [Bryobacterales bacterium]